MNGKGEGLPDLPLGVTADTRITTSKCNSMFLAFPWRTVNKPAHSHMKVRSTSYAAAPRASCLDADLFLSVPLNKTLYLTIRSQGLVCILQAVPVLPAQGQGHPGEAVGTVFGDVSVHSLGSSWVSHRHELVKQRLRDYILGNKRKEIITLARSAGFCSLG